MRYRTDKLLIATHREMAIGADAGNGNNRRPNLALGKIIVITAEYPHYYN